MVILRKDFGTKEIEIPGFRKFLNNPKHPDYKELRIYTKNGWTPIDPDDDEKEIQRAKKRKLNAKKNKERRPKYIEMEKNIQKLKDNKELLQEFNKKRETKNNYNNVLKWYNDEVKSKLTEEDAKGEDKTSAKTEKGAKGEAK